MSTSRTINSQVVVGAQWGDEGKAKIVDMLAEHVDMVIRSQGGCNAGHTVVHQGETFKFHHLPSGLLYEGKTCIIGSGMVLAPDVLKGEIEAIEARGYSTQGLRISDRAHVTLPYHCQLDQALEARRSGGKIGTTGRGIGPTYMDKVGRVGLRVVDLFEPEAILAAQLERLLLAKEPLTNLLPTDEHPTLEKLLDVARNYKAILAPYVCDIQALLYDAQKQGKTLLFEGAQGTLLDVDFGTYPFVTSSNATAGGACTGSGVGPSKIDYSTGVMKAYLTRVGEGPFPTELSDAVGDYLTQKGHEIGTTTGRTRRCGWFDAVVGRYSVQVNGLDGIALTKLDVLDELSEIKVAVAYRDKLTGETYEQFPASLSKLAQAEPVYESFPGWQTDTSHVCSFEDLPTACQEYVKRLEALCDCPITWISVGPDRAQTFATAANQQIAVPC